ncbi:SPARC-like protein 1 [Xiphophorus couchianus]|uniref:SPARC-like protein 1 n=1 Tax=Xiphophorus couchianus TaxID=32473 RepID=UPI001016C92D|nr:SPARC-like protein 1 [Xiphophorus couchianus]
MRVSLIFLFFLGATFAPSVTCKSHGKQDGMQETSHSATEKDVITMEGNRPQISSTLANIEASSQEPEDEEVSSAYDTNTNKEGEEVEEKIEKRTAVLLSEEELVGLLTKEAEEDEEAEEIEDEVTMMDEKKANDSSEAVKMLKYEAKKKEDSEDKEAKAKDKAEKPAFKLTERSDPVGLLEETESSTESELPVNLDYATDSGILIPAQVKSEDLNPSTENKESPSKKDLQYAKKEVGEKELLMQDMPSPEAGDREEMTDQSKDSSTKSKEKHASKEKLEATMDHQEFQSNVGLISGLRRSEKEEGKDESDSGAFSKRKTKKQKKNKRPRKHSPQRNETHPIQDQGQLNSEESEGSSTENVVHKAKRKWNGKWGPLVGVNPVQIRGSVDLYPRSRSFLSGDVHLSRTPPDPCDNFRCKRGKTCKLDADSKPGCVCQDPLECPSSMNTFEHVCGTDNKTYDTSCELFATKCNLEGTKRGYKLHLDYTGPCKLIPQCVKNELVQFPLRMRDWLKNVLLQLYEHDSISPGFLTPKQRFRVKKIFENEKRLHAGNHSVELLAQDFEKNYNMYIYPVHWQFAQLDQHPSDRSLSHSELAPLRVPLVPMEHCTSVFFQECDADKDKQVTLKEWTSCFGIKDEDVDVNLLF